MAIYKPGGTGSGTVVAASFASTNTRASSMATIPFDDIAPPQSSEGTELLTVTHTRKGASNTLIVMWVGWFSTFNGDNVGVALFQDSTANALAVTVATTLATDYSKTIFLQHTLSAGSTGDTTFKIRAGGNTATTTNFLEIDTGNADRFDTAALGTLVVLEVL